MLEPSEGRLLPRAWRPPCPFPVFVRYQDKTRPPDSLWTMPWLAGEDGRVVCYLAAGPAGQPAGNHLVWSVRAKRIPVGAHVRVLTEVDSYGRTVYARPDHTLN